MEIGEPEREIIVVPESDPIPATPTPTPTPLPEKEPVESE